MQQRLLKVGGKLPTTSVGRLSRAVLAGMRGGLLAWRSKDAAEGALDVDSIAALVSSIGQLKGMAMKAGQLLSYLEVSLPVELRGALSALQTHSPPMPFERVTETIERELGNHAAALLARMDREPVAAASIGQVHRAKVADGLEVAVKVQYPHIEEALRADFRPAAAGTTFIKLLVPGSDVNELVSEVQKAVLEECDYEREARQQKHFWTLYADHPTLVTPEVHSDFSSKHVLTTTWMNGIRFDEFLSRSPSQPQRDRVGEALFEFYVGSVFKYGLYNWDPHPGNYVFRHDGRIAMLDYGSTREFEHGFVEKLARLTLALHTGTRDAVRDALLGLGMIHEGEAHDLDAALALVRSFYGPMLNDEVVAIGSGASDSLRTVFEGKRELLKLHLPRELLFILRIRLGLMSVLARLGARANWYRLERAFIEKGIGNL